VIQNISDQHAGDNRIEFARKQAHQAHIDQVQSVGHPGPAPAQYFERTGHDPGLNAVRPFKFTSQGLQSFTPTRQQDQIQATLGQLPREQFINACGSIGDQGPYFSTNSFTHPLVFRRFSELAEIL
jgi:hypothetical protein